MTFFRTSLKISARPSSYLLSGVNSMYASQVLLCVNIPPWVNTVCIACVCLRCIVPHLVWSPHTGWRTSAAFSWLQNPCWRLPGCATSLSLCAVAQLATPQRYSVKRRENVHSARTSIAHCWCYISQEYNRVHSTIDQEVEATVFLVLLYYLIKVNIQS